MKFEIVFIFIIIFITFSNTLQIQKKNKNINKILSFSSEKKKNEKYMISISQFLNPQKNIMDNILIIKDGIENEKTNILDKNVINDEIFLITKGKIETLEKITNSELQKLNQNQLNKLEKYLQSIPTAKKLAKVIDNKLGGVIQSPQNTLLIYPQNNLQKNNLQNFPQNYRGKNVSYLARNKNLSIIPKSSSVLGLISAYKKFNELGRIGNIQRSKEKLGRRSKYYNYQIPRKILKTNPNYLSNFKPTELVKSIVTDDTNQNNKININNRNLQQNFKNSLNKMMSKQSFSQFKSKGNQRQIASIFNKLNQNNNNSRNTGKRNKLNRRFKSAFAIKDYDQYEEDFNNDIDDDELSNVLKNKSSVNKTFINNRPIRRNIIDLGKSTRFGNGKSDDDKYRTMRYNYFNMKNRNLNSKLLKISEFLLEKFFEILQNKVLSFEYYMTKYNINSQQKEFLKDAIKRFYYPIISEKMLVRLLDDSLKIHFMEEDYLKRAFLKVMPHRIYRTLHDFMEIICDEMKNNGLRNLNDVVLENIARFIYV